MSAWDCPDCGLPGTRGFLCPRCDRAARLAIEGAEADAERWELRGESRYDEEEEAEG